MLSQRVVPPGIMWVLGAGAFGISVPWTSSQKKKPALNMNSGQHIPQKIAAELQSIKDENSEARKWLKIPQKIIYYMRKEKNSI